MNYKNHTLIFHVIINYVKTLETIITELWYINHNIVYVVNYFFFQSKKHNLVFQNEMKTSLSMISSLFFHKKNRLNFKKSLEY
jgi:hypothetical protein